MKLQIITILLFSFFLIQCGDVPPIASDICEITDEICTYASLICEEIGTDESLISKSDLKKTDLIQIRDTLSSKLAQVKMKSSPMTLSEKEKLYLQLHALKLKLKNIYFDVLESKSN